jgi:hypothetical protein
LATYSSLPGGANTGAGTSAVFAVVAEAATLLRRIFGDFPDCCAAASGVTEMKEHVNARIKTARTPRVSDWTRKRRKVFSRK